MTSAKLQVLSNSMHKAHKETSLKVTDLWKLDSKYDNINYQSYLKSGVLSVKKKLIDPDTISITDY